MGSLLCCFNSDNNGQPTSPFPRDPPADPGPFASFGSDPVVVQSDEQIDEQIYKQQLQILAEMGFAEDDARRALKENGNNEFLALLMLCVQDTNTEA